MWLSRTATPEPALVIEAEHLDFGEAWEQSRFAWTLPVRNRHHEAVEVVGFGSNCTCALIEPSTFVLPAGETREVRLLLDLTAKTAKEADAAFRDFKIEISPKLATGDSPVWPVRGRVRTAIRFETPLVDFGRNSELAQPLPPRKLLITSYLPLGRLRFDGAPNHFLTQVRRDPNDELRWELEITPRDALPDKSISYSLLVTPYATDGKELPAKALPVRGLLVADIQATPSIVHFGALDVGRKGSASLTLDSLSGRAFRVDAWECEGEEMSVEPAAGGPELSPTFRVTQRVVREGEVGGAVVFSVVYEDGARATVRVPVVSLGTQALDEPLRGSR